MKNKYKGLTIEKIEQALKDVFPEEGFRHDTWINPDGSVYSSWQFKSIASKKGERSIYIHTGDGGALEILKAMHKELKKRFGNLKN